MHFIDEKWQIHSLLLDFVRFKTLHDGEHVKRHLEESIAKWGIKDKSVAVTTDNGAEMIRGMQFFRSSLEQDCVHVRCLAHIIKIVVKAANKKMHDCVRHLRTLISSIRSSAKRRESFYDLKDVYGPADATQPGLDVETRWSSTYLMLKSAWKAKSILNAMTSDDDVAGTPIISNDSWAFIEKLLNLVKV